MLKSRNEDCSLRAGFILNKKLGGAVLRNKIKRVIKEFLRKSNINIQKSIDILFIVKKADNIIDLQELKKDLEKGLESFLSI